MIKTPEPKGWSLKVLLLAPTIILSELAFYKALSAYVLYIYRMDHTVCLLENDELTYSK